MGFGFQDSHLWQICVRIIVLCAFVRVKFVHGKRPYKVRYLKIGAGFFYVRQESMCIDASLYVNKVMKRTTSKSNVLENLEKKDLFPAVNRVLSNNCKKLSTFNMCM